MVLFDVSHLSISVTLCFILLFVFGIHHCRHVGHVVIYFCAFCRGLFLEWLEGGGNQRLLLMPKGS
jgi:hypothetical protein